MSRGSASNAASRAVGVICLTLQLGTLVERAFTTASRYRNINMAPTNSIRTYVLTASVAAITATGAWYGAGLKTRQEYKQVSRLVPQDVSSHLTDEYSGKKCFAAA